MIANAPALLGAADLTPGTRVVVFNCGCLTGLHGVVTEMPEGVWNGSGVVAVRLDNGRGGFDRELGFYMHELAVEE